MEWEFRDISCEFVRNFMDKYKGGNVRFNYFRILFDYFDYFYWVINIFCIYIVFVGLYVCMSFFKIIYFF